VASVSEEPVLLFKNANACALMESKATEFAFKTEYIDAKDPATLETSRLRASASPTKSADKFSKREDSLAASVTAITDMSPEHMRKEAPKESTASMPRNLTPFAKVMDENEGECELLSSNPLAEGLQGSLNERSRYLMGRSSSLQLAVIWLESFIEMCNLVCMAVITQESPKLPSQASENSAPLQVGGELTLIDSDASADTLVKMFVTMQVNLITETLKNAAFTIKLEDRREVNASSDVRGFDDVHSNL